MGHVAHRAPPSARRPAPPRRWWPRAGLAVAAGGLLLAACSSPAPRATGTTSTSTTTTTGATTATTTGGPDCPLTGLPAPGGAVPRRAAVAVKVDNYLTARPQTGLTKADLVFEEPVEGGITRYVAVFQCQGTGEVGPVRSARNIDVGILGQLGHPIEVHVGGITPVIANIRRSPITDFELGDYTSLIQHPAGRFAPYDTYTSVTGVWKTEPSATTPPQPLFAYSKAVPAGTHVTSVSVPFSFYAPVVWKYDAASNDWLRYYTSTPDKLSNGVQNSATNVVVQFVHIYYGPWLENSTGGYEVQANLYTQASGTALVFRDGVEIKGKWARTTLGQPTRFTTTTGAPIDLAPGTTWVELVPSTVKVTTTPAG